jgi:tryptophan-rich sensory protein
MIIRTIIFLVLNFAALGIGSISTGKGVPSEWYQNLNQAPWTPPGWMFGLAWTTIMVCFAVYMAVLWKEAPNRNTVLLLFAVQWVLNVAWNPVFFQFHMVLAGLVIIFALTILLAVFFFGYLSEMKAWTALVAPYFIWLIIATSLNAYILLNN